MPEIQECYCSGLQLQTLFAKHSECRWRLQALHCDATVHDEKPQGSRQEAGLVFQLTPSSCDVRGNTSHQTPLWPPFLAAGTPSAGFCLQDLVLTAVKYTSRSVVLNLGRCWFQLQYLTHTSIQMYDREQWAVLKETSYIGKGTLKMRSFRIGLALEFDTFVIAFVSHDQVFQVTWALMEASLAHHDLQVLDEWDAVLAGIATWSKRYYEGKRKGKRLARDVLRFTPDVWFGIGVYTACEILFVAGIPPFLREQEVFGNPSRLARVALAYHAFVHKAVHKTWPNRVKPCVRNNIVAPTTEERLQMGRSMYIWAKDTVGVSQRLLDRIQNYNYEGSISCSDDPFEPTLIRVALERSPHLGRVVFGETWGEIAPDDLRSPSTKPDPLTEYVTKKKLLDCHDTRIHIANTSPLFLPTNDLSRRRAPTHYYSVTGKAVWSIVPAPDEVQFQLKEDEKATKTLRYIVTNTAQVGVGPLEYCANAQVVRKSLKGRARKFGSRFYVLPSLGAIPSNVPLSIGRRHLASFDHKKSLTLEAREKRNEAARAAAKKALAKKKRKSNAMKMLSGNAPLTTQQRNARAAQRNIFDSQSHIVGRGGDHDLQKEDSGVASDVEEANPTASKHTTPATPPPDTRKRRVRADHEVVANQNVVQELPRARRTRGVELNMSEHPNDAAIGIHKRKRRCHSSVSVPTSS
ncbi:uncharacterized protein B0H18DRAFT_557401 [Fomitopsis serialis]|uniref:uncharacterized protein n=1 Tax=Fomitopsis serialis TaxID=139415 RepID=UPI00200811FB|nr:uncharacterized protein B0H18DRAFT_557401 [Neoantrodia serialis]KAH9934376.1 hypothetical protein B0H18DRAFT_557401 [Neoantrodia serialis]